MNTNSDATPYLTKNPKYFGFSRSEMLKFVPESASRILEVGCGAGLFGELLKARGKCCVHGVELVPEMAAEARGRLDHVWEGLFPGQADMISNSYDAVVFNDVLEHMTDPWSALAFAKSILTRNGVVVASIPNVRHFPVVWALLFGGTWEYANSGVLDKTHFRFFTRSGIEDLFQTAGYQQVTIEGIHRYGTNRPADNELWRYLKLLQLVTGSKFRDMGFRQFAVVAVPNSCSQASS